MKNKQPNPNDVTAKYYDIVHQSYKSQQITEAECALMQTIVDPGSMILDVGSGTGRHAKLLAKMGYQVTCIDNSSTMLQQIGNHPNINKLLVDFFDYDFTGQKYDLIIVMWNAFNEMVLTKQNLKKFWQICKQILKLQGVILINTTLKQFPPISDYTSNIQANTANMNFEWKIIKAQHKTHTTLSQETLRTETERLIYQTWIKQRWWTLQEVKSSAKAYNFGIKKLKLQHNFEDYLLLTIQSTNKS